MVPCVVVLREIEREMEEVPGFDLDFLFFGGGVQGLKFSMKHKCVEINILLQLPMNLWEI